MTWSYLPPLSCSVCSRGWPSLQGLARAWIPLRLPSASPMVLLYARVARQAQSRGQSKRASASIAAFAGGYIALWILFSLVAVPLQWMLEHSGALSVLMNSRSTLMSGALLIAAGLYQLTPLKAACLKQCRAPISFIATYWRPGVFGAWRMGLDHGLYCVGCCAVLMLLLFVGGIMNLVWIAGSRCSWRWRSWRPSTQLRRAQRQRS
jgi:predicted metal-binding membrane protein